MNKKYRLGFIGFGKMATAIAQGLIKNKTLSNKQVYATDVNPSQLKLAAKKMGIKALGSNTELAQSCNIIILAIKPFHMQEVLNEIKMHIPANTLIISIAAGIPLRALRVFKQKVFLVRVMPNTPAMLGAGITGIYFDKKVPQTLKQLCAKLFKSVGDIVCVAQEKQIDAITALSGSGPAFVYYFAQAMIAGGIQVGLNAIDANKLTLATLAGAAKMLTTTGLTPEALIAQVTSKKGTTLAGLDHMKKSKFAKIVEQTINAAHQRAQSISANKILKRK